MMVPTRRRLAMSLALAAAQVGCSTETMWRGANEATVGSPAVVGVTPGRPPGRCALVVSYKPQWGDEQDLLSVPLTADGRPVPPFGLTVSAGDVWANVPAAQRSALLVRAVDRLGACPGDGDGLPVVGKYDRRVGPGYDPSDVDHGLFAIAYQLDAARGVHVVPFDHAGPKGARRPQVPAGAAVVMVPWEMPRPAASRDANRTRAAVLTPLTVTFDATLLAASGIIYAIVLPPVLLFFAVRDACR